MSRNNAQFTLLKHLTPKGSIFDTKEPQIDLTLILPVYLGSLLPKLFSAYLAWLHAHDVTQLITDGNPAIRVTKATMLLQIGAALEDEEFRVAATEYLKMLYGGYDGDFGLVPRSRREW